MEQKIKPLPTPYKNIMFRTKLEAIWAVYFDKIGLEWKYEEQGYQLSNGQWYLPDFRIIGYGWIEIKGCEPTEEEIEKCRLLSINDLDDGEVMLIDGKPDFNRGYRTYNNGESVCPAVFTAYSVSKWGTIPFYCGGLEQEGSMWDGDEKLVEKAISHQFFR